MLARCLRPVRSSTLFSRFLTLKATRATPGEADVNALRLCLARICLISLKCPFSTICRFTGIASGTISGPRGILGGSFCSVSMGLSSHFTAVVDFIIFIFLEFVVEVC